MLIFSQWIMLRQALRASVVHPSSGQGRCATNHRDSVFKRNHQASVAGQKNQSPLCPRGITRPAGKPPGSYLLFDCAPQPYTEQGSRLLCTFQTNQGHGAPAPPSCPASGQLEIVCEAQPHIARQPRRHVIPQVAAVGLPLQRIPRHLCTGEGRNHRPEVWVGCAQPYTWLSAATCVCPAKPQLPGNRARRQTLAPAPACAAPPGWTPAAAPPPAASRGGSVCGHRKRWSCLSEL